VSDTPDNIDITLPELFLRQGLAKVQAELNQADFLTATPSESFAEGIKISDFLLKFVSSLRTE